MEESMTDDDFIIEEEGTSSSRRPFLIAVATLTTIFILASVCSLVFLFSNRSSTNPEATAIAATNAVILITNEAVTAAIDATNIALLRFPAASDCGGTQWRDDDRPTVREGQDQRRGLVRPVVLRGPGWQERGGGSRNERSGWRERGGRAQGTSLWGAGMQWFIEKGTLGVGKCNGSSIEGTFGVHECNGLSKKEP